MLTSLGLIFLSGLLLSRLCRRIGLPHIVGLLLAGILLGPCCLGLLDEQILSVSPELRRMALVIILIKAGLSLDIGDLERIGRPALMMSFVPASFEILGFVLLGPYPRTQPRRVRRAGIGPGRRITGRRRSPNGAAYGGRLWGQKGRTADDTCRCVDG